MALQKSNRLDDSGKGLNSKDTENDDDDDVCAWQRIGPPIATISSPWITVIAERYSPDKEGDALIDYWRIERASSVIVISIYQDHYILPAPQFRPGLQHCTLDFAGGRRRDDESVIDTAKRLLVKELGLTQETVQEHVQFKALNEENESSSGWPVDSSVSNQALYGVVAFLDKEIDDSTWQGSGVVRYPLDQIDHLLIDLPCLQCRAVLLEWLYRQRKTSQP